jgi:hypothetical protein
VEKSSPPNHSAWYVCRHSHVQVQWKNPPHQTIQHGTFVGTHSCMYSEIVVRWCRRSGSDWGLLSSHANTCVLLDSQNCIGKSMTGHYTGNGGLFPTLCIPRCTYTCTYTHKHMPTFMYIYLHTVTEHTHPAPQISDIIIKSRTLPQP